METWNIKFNEVIIFLRILIYQVLIIQLWL
jgi:hypothetical protein